MRTIIAGTRTFSDYDVLAISIAKSKFKITEVVSGGARGADALGETWAWQHKIDRKVFPADWKLFGKRAGPIRNQQMAEYAEACIAIWDGRSRGTLDMIERAHLRGLKLFIHPTEISFENSPSWKILIMPFTSEA